MKRRKKYTGNLHDQPHELEGSVFDRVKKDPDYDRRDLADQAYEYRTTHIPVKEQISHGKAMRGAAERGSDGNDAADGLGEMGGSPRRRSWSKVVTGQLIQDGGGYAAQTDPASNYAERYYGYCLNCGEPINHVGPRVCEVEQAGGDQCVLEAPKGYLITGCQSCREWWDLDRGYHRSGRGRQAKTCKPTDEERAAWTRKGTVKSRCAREWAAKLKQAERKGIDRDTAERTLSAVPKLRDHDRIRLERDRLSVELRADRERKRQADRVDLDEYNIVLKLLPEDAPSVPTQSQPAGVNGTGFRSVPGRKDWSQAEEVVRLPLMGEETITRLDQAIQGLRDSGRL